MNQPFFPPLVPFKIRTFLGPLLTHILYTNCMHLKVLPVIWDRMILMVTLLPRCRFPSFTPVYPTASCITHHSPQTYFQTTYSPSLWWSHHLYNALVHTLGRPISLKDPVSSLSSEIICTLSRLLQALNITFLWIYLLSFGPLQPRASYMPPQPSPPCTLNEFNIFLLRWRCCWMLNGSSIWQFMKLKITVPYPSSSAFFFLFLPLLSPVFPLYPQLILILGLPFLLSRASL